MTGDLLRDNDAERALIGAVMQQPGILKDIDVAPGDFAGENHRLIWEAVRAIGADDQFPDPVAIAGRLGADRLRKAGGADYLTALVNECPYSLNHREYANRIKEVAWKRKELAELTRQATLVAKPDTAPETIAKILQDHATAFSESLKATERAEAPAMPRYVVYDALDALKPRPPREWVIDQLVLERSLNLWTGRFGSKKSWSMLDAAVSVAIGTPWVGFATRPQTVLYIDQDMGLDNVLDYLEKCIKGHLAENYIGEKIKFISSAGFDLSKPDDVNQIHAEIVRTGAGLVFMDSLRTFNNGRDENSVKEMQPALTTLRQLVSTTGTAFIVSHHENKAGDFSGSTAIAAGVDSMMSVKSEEDSQFIYFKTGKKRAGKPQYFAAEAVWAADQFYLNQADMEALKKPDQTQLDVFNYFEESGDASIKELTGHFALVSRGKLYRALNALVDSKKIIRKNPTAANKDGAIYGIRKGGYE